MQTKNLKIGGQYVVNPNKDATIYTAVGRDTFNVMLTYSDGVELYETKADVSTLQRAHKKQIAEACSLIINAPALKHDEMMLKRYKTEVAAIGIRERRIVSNLIHRLGIFGWRPSAVFDGDDMTEVTSGKAALELIFDLDEARLFFKKGGVEHSVVLTLGNDMDIITDWTFSHTGDEFSSIMDGFNVKRLA